MLAAELGFTPSARARLGAFETAAGHADDPWAVLPVDQSRHAGGKSTGSVIANPIFQTQFGILGEIGDVIGDQRHPQCDGMRGNQLVECIPLALTGGQTHRAIGKRGGTIKGCHGEIFQQRGQSRPIAGLLLTGTHDPVFEFGERDR